MAAAAAPRAALVACGITAFLLTGCNVYHSYFTTIPKTYALAALLLLAGLAALWNPDQLRAAWRAALGGLLLAGAACTRLSLGIALPVAGLYLLFYARRWRWVWFAFGLGGLAGLALLLGPPLLHARDAFLFSNFCHTSRGTEGLLFAAGSVSRLLRHYMPLALLVRPPCRCSVAGSARRALPTIRRRRRRRASLSPCRSSWQTLWCIC